MALYSSIEEIVSLESHFEDLLKKRSIVENTFSWLQNNRRIRLRYEVSSKSYNSFYHLAMIDLIMNKVDI